MKMTNNGYFVGILCICDMLCFRWYTAFQNSKKGDWTYDEDKTIWLHVQKHGPTKWAALARSLRHRSDNAVLLRYKRLEKWSHVTVCDVWFKFTQVIQ